MQKRTTAFESFVKTKCKSYNKTYVHNVGFKITPLFIYSRIEIPYKGQREMHWMKCELEVRVKLKQ